MQLLLWNLLLALTWSVAVGELTLGNFIVGMVIGFIVLWLCRRVLGRSAYFQKVPQVCRFILFYLKELIVANLRVAIDVMTPGYFMKPGIIAIPLEARTDAEITLLANLITLTPGTLSLFLSPDRRVLYLHVMYIDGDVESVKRNIKETMERRVLEVMR